MKEALPKLSQKTLTGSPSVIFFAGIGGWPLALRLAGVSEDTPLWTGSPPCQPFSAAGKQLGQFDPRHLAPVFLDLISECRPPVLFGEQVAPAIAKSWMCDLQTHLEGEDYAVGFAVLPACSVGAPHKRDRLFFGAHRLAHTRSITNNKRCEYAQYRRQNETEQTGLGRCDGGMAHSDDTRPQGRERVPERANEQSAGAGSVESKLADATKRRRGEECPDTEWRVVRDSEEGWAPGRGTSGGYNTTNTHNGFWSDADWLGCRDGKFRPVESGTFPLANGMPARVGRLRGYGNAIVPQVAAEFIKAFMGVVNE